MIYYGRQSVNEQDIKAVEEVLRSDFLTQGPAIERFERRVADYCGAKYAVAVTNAAKPTAQITPAPVPTITPNVKGYHNLTMGTKGKEVKKLQEKLIEKGYVTE